MGIVTGWWRADEQHETSWQGRLQQRLELARVATLDKEAVRVVAIWQRDYTDVHALLSEPAGKQLRRMLAAAVRIGIKGQIDGSRTVAQLAILLPVEMTSHRTGDVVKTGLPQHGVVEQTLDKNHVRILPDLLPCVQATLGARQKAVRWRRNRQAAGIEIALQWKHDAVHVGVVATGSYQTGLMQCVERIAQLCQPTPQAAAGRVANPHVL